MLRSTVRLVAAVLLAVGLLCAPPASLDASAKSKKPAKTSSSRDAKKGGKKDAKRGAKSSNSRTAKKDTRSRKGKNDRRSDARTAKSNRNDRQQRVAKSTPRRGKNDADDDDDSRASRSRRTAPSPAVAKRTVDDADADDEDGEDEEEPPGPRPANRIVADIATTRVIQIQSALIQKGLLTGPTTGVYDQPTFQAMQAFQSRNGWTPVGVPTADSLKALGVPKNTGRALMTPARMVEATAPPR